jgi:hypothetical protein
MVIIVQIGVSFGEQKKEETEMSKRKHSHTKKQPPAKLIRPTTNSSFLCDDVLTLIVSHNRNSKEMMEQQQVSKAFYQAVWNSSYDHWENVTVTSKQISQFPKDKLAVIRNFELVESEDEELISEEVIRIVFPNLLYLKFHQTRISMDVIFACTRLKGLVFWECQESEDNEEQEEEESTDSIKSLSSLKKLEIIPYKCLEPYTAQIMQLNM